ncbi:MAG TPA: Gfo/Idh/MocA family oxidoreductase [Spirochaetia bacterium]|nr:Gfo/Idh/MocA family oxidoreductase [Spirochaetia bacterium]
MKSAFSVVGGAGFRAQYFLRIAAALPDEFAVAGTVVRDAKRRDELGKRWAKELGLLTYATVDDLLRHETPDFIILSVPREETPGYLIRFAQLGIPVLAETPPASDLQDLLLLHERLVPFHYRIQVAEQYQFHPHQAARLSLLQGGRIGKVTEATVSFSHLYHAASLLRLFLGIGFENAEISGMRFEAHLVAGPDRGGPPSTERVITAPRDLAWLNFGDKLGIYDFQQNQHRSWIRSCHVLIRGERGEVFDDRVLSLADFATPLTADLRRVNRGEQENPEGYFLRGILCGEKWVYRNPFAPARLYDDEVAIATSLRKMAEYVRSGSQFYGLAEASQDTYIGLMIESAIRTGTLVSMTTQPWAASR